MIALGPGAGASAGAPGGNLLCDVYLQQNRPVGKNLVVPGAPGAAKRHEQELKPSCVIPRDFAAQTFLIFMRRVLPRVARARRRRAGALAPSAKTAASAKARGAKAARRSQPHRRRRDPKRPS